MSERGSVSGATERGIGSMPVLLGKLYHTR